MSGMQSKPAFNDWSAEFNEHDVIVMRDFIGSNQSSSDDLFPLIRQDAKIGNDLLRFMGGLRCQKSPNGKGCPNQLIKYGMCSIHWKKWKKKNPWLKYPGHY